MAKKPFSVTMRIVAHVTVHTNAEGEGDADEKVCAWFDKYWPTLMEGDSASNHLAEIETVDVHELDEDEAKVDEDNKDLA